MNATPITSEDFRATPGLANWQVSGDAAVLVLRTPDFSAGADLIAEIARIADAIDHHPDVDLRYGSVTIRTTTHSTGGLTTNDQELARSITRLAAERGLAVADR